jgi:hypothetical protein
MDKGNWFWHSRFMTWVEGALLDLTNWVWNKRHISPYKKTPNTRSNKSDPWIEPTLDVVSPPAAKKAPAKKVAKKASAKKSTWTAK